MLYLEFAILGVFAIASSCPCGIGLAAPTAFLVGSGLAAKHGILAWASGEAFQVASQIHFIVLDKTGTLTEGSEPKVTDVMPQDSDSEKSWNETIIAIVIYLAFRNSHPPRLSLRNYYQNGGGALPMGLISRKFRAVGWKVCSVFNPSPIS